MPTLVALDRMSKRYEGRQVLREVDVTVADDDFVLVVGENGSGKTTLLRLLARTLPASTGQVRWSDASDVTEARRRTAYVAHQPLLYHELTALENVTFVLQIHGVLDPKGEARAALTGFGSDPGSRDAVARLSRGQQQRVALARAFALRPRLLLLDEPGTSLDADGRELLFRHLERLRGTCAVILATHDTDTYRSLATRAWRLAGGRVREEAV